MKPVHPLRTYRVERGLKLRDIADKFGVQTNTVWRWENWERTPDHKHLPALAEMTGAPIADLLFKLEAAE